MSGAWTREHGDWSESSRRFADVDEHVRVEGSVGDMYQPVLKTVETVELEPSCPGVQQFRPVSEQSKITDLQAAFTLT